MSRNVLPALELVRDGRWTIDTLEQWLHAVIQNDHKFIKEVTPKILEKFSAKGK
jgi:hypothetical protein